MTTLHDTFAQVIRIELTAGTGIPGGLPTDDPGAAEAVKGLRCGASMPLEHLAHRFVHFRIGGYRHEDTTKVIPEGPLLDQPQIQATKRSRRVSSIR